VQDLSLHILDIAENAINAQAGRIAIQIQEDIPNNRLTLVIEDNGRGMDQAAVDTAVNPFFTTRTTRRIGLGLSLFEQSAKEADGSMRIYSEPGKGTRVVATFVNNHIDRKPLGNMADTMITLIAGNPDIDFVFEYVKTGFQSYRLDTAWLKSELDDVPISAAEVLEAIKNDIEQGLEPLLKVI
jgi:anti-sigma regulatory factor (Ser/Thr protein kinase)